MNRPLRTNAREFLTTSTPRDDVNDTAADFQSVAQGDENSINRVDAWQSVSNRFSPALAVEFIRGRSTQSQLKTQDML
ncbi:MAG: hypothetical protein N2559_12930 [Anaerolineae bacterium]|nr:hypothetical protein [Anaerolineae bacterium]